MNEQEYRYWADYVKEYVPLQKGALESYENWHNRALLGRLLANLNIYKPAIELLESILEEVKQEDDEQYIWSLSDLADYYWVSTGDKEHSIELLNLAIDCLSQKTVTSFPLINRGLLYNQMWQIHALSGDTDKVTQEIYSIIKNEEVHKKEEKTNSLLFYSYFNLALLAFEKEDTSQAIQLLKQAYTYSEVNLKEVDHILTLDLSPQGTVSQLLSLTHRHMQFDC
ncbi:hypothetical protein TEPIDINF_000976 [Tepidibacillus infernus]|uniref:hypothetical protein n=1 Tax=Tepidibacillus infernus TaxID=1806172 RepID=UPI003A33B681